MALSLYAPAPWNMAGQVAHSLSGDCQSGSPWNGHMATILPWSLALEYHKGFYPSHSADCFSSCLTAILGGSWSEDNYHPHFPDEEIEAQGGYGAPQGHTASYW